MAKCWAKTGVLKAKIERPAIPAIIFFLMVFLLFLNNLGGCIREDGTPALLLPNPPRDSGDFLWLIILKHLLECLSVARLLIMVAAKYKIYLLDDKTERRARMLSLAGDPTRLRILCFMFEYRAATVGDIAKSLQMSVPCISHHLQIMKDNGYFTTKRFGKNIRYALVDSKFNKEIKRVVCGF